MREGILLPALSILIVVFIWLVLDWLLLADRSTRRKPKFWILLAAIAVGIVFLYRMAFPES